MLLAKAWRDWRTALIVVQPDTVVRWHRQWLRRRWTQRSTHTRPGRPSTAAAIRTLVDQMGAANPLWGAPRIHGELGKLGIDGLGADRVAAPAATPSSTVTDVANLPDESRDVPGVDGLLHRADTHRPRAVRARAAQPTTVAKSSTWRSPNIPQPHGRRNRSLRPFRTTPRRAGSSEIAMPSMATCSGAVSPAWA